MTRIIPLFIIGSKKKPELNVEELLEKNISELYVLNTGDDIKIDFVEELSGIFNIWFEPCKSIIDIIDVLVAGCEIAVLSEDVSIRTIEEALSYTDKVGLRIDSENSYEKLESFITLGGKFIISKNLNILLSLKNEGVNKIFITDKRLININENFYLVMPYEVIHNDRKA